jgi:hypothetical protein
MIFSLFSVQWVMPRGVMNLLELVGWFWKYSELGDLGSGAPLPALVSLEGAE